LPETPEEVLELKPDSPEVSISREKRRFSWKIYLQIAIVLGALGLSIYFYQLSKKTADPSPNPTPGVHPSVKGKLENVSPKEKTGQDKERR
jgi:flagellar basal body-associated protein FliL